MELYYMKDGKAEYERFEDRNEANKVFLEKKAAGIPMITNGPKGIKYWNSEKLDWFIPIIEMETNGYDNSVECDVLSEVWEMTICKKPKDTFVTDDKWRRDDEFDNVWEVWYDGKKYILTEEYVRADEMIASWQGTPDKYTQYTFWKDGKELTSFCYEC